MDISMVSREVNNVGSPLINAVGNPLKGADIQFTLVDAKGKPIDAYDVFTRERIAGTVRVKTNDIGEFSVYLWPTTRGDKPVYYQVHVNYIGFIDFISGLSEGNIPVDFAALRSFGRETKPLEAALIQNTLDNMLEMLGIASHKMPAGVNGVVAYQIVMLDSLGSVTTADPYNPLHAGKVIGIALSTGNFGDTITVARQGSISNNTWSLIPGETYFLGTGGTLAIEEPNSGFIQSLGIAETPITLYIQLGTVTIL